MKKIVISTLIAAMVTSSLFSVSAAAYDGVETFDHCEIYSSTEIKAIEDMSGYTAAMSGVCADVNYANPYYEDMVQRFEEFCAENNLDKSLESLDMFKSTLVSTYEDESTKLNIRASCSLAAIACGIAGYPMIEETLSHSCQDNPPALTWTIGNQFSNEIKTCPQYQNLVNDIKASLRYASGDRWYDNGSLTLNSPTDVKLSLHSVDYAVSAVKEGSTWNIYIGFSDKYDYACIENAEEAGVNELIAFANNYAYSAQQLGSIVPYNILAYMRETY